MAGNVQMTGREFVRGFKKAKGIANSGVVVKVSSGNQVFTFKAEKGNERPL
jgi:hypothetical protein